MKKLALYFVTRDGGKRCQSVGLTKEGRTISRSCGQQRFLCTSVLLFALVLLSLFTLNYSFIFNLSIPTAYAAGSSTTDLSLDVPTTIGVAVTNSSPRCSGDDASSLCLEWADDSTHAAGTQNVAVTYNGSRTYTMQAITGDNRLYTRGNRFSLNYQCYFSGQTDCTATANTSATYEFTYRIDQPQYTLTADDYTGTIKYVATVEPEIDDTQTVWNYDYLGAPQVFTASKAGKYRLEVWGAGGGHSTLYQYRGETVGGYGVGTIDLAAGAKLYVVVGDSGNNSGYNGGYPATPNGGASGGATHIAKARVGSGILSAYKDSTDDLLIVAGGGAGNDFFQISEDISPTGNGGGWSVWQPNPDTNYGTEEGSFGQGGVKCTGSATSSAGDYDCGAAGGGGFRGGDSGHVKSGFGGGGTGYIGNSRLQDKHMYSYDGTASSDADTRTIVGTCASETPTANCAKIGVGYARITFLGAE